MLGAAQIAKRIKATKKISTYYKRRGFYDLANNEALQKLKLLKQLKALGRKRRW